MHETSPNPGFRHPGHDPIAEAGAAERGALDTPLPRRRMLAALGMGTAALAAGGPALAGQDPGAPSTPSPAVLSPRELGFDPRTGRYVLPPLPYEYEALEPHIDTKTMHLHHDSHHAAYVAGLNDALDRLQETRSGRRDRNEVGEWSRRLAFNASGHFLHVVYWNCMIGSGSKASGLVETLIRRDFGTPSAMLIQFKAAAKTVEGSGWAILGHEPISNRLIVLQAEKHQNLATWGVTPLVALDMWEHAYYLRYKNQKKKYIEAFVNLINWDFVNRKLATLGLQA